MFIDDNGVTAFVDDLGALVWIDDNGVLLGARTFVLHLV
jgi:hypothetical protein